MKLKQLQTYGSAIPANLSTESAAEDDTLGARVENEYRRFERQCIDFQYEVTRRTDLMRGEHLRNLRALLGDSEEAAQ